MSAEVRLGRLSSVRSRLAPIAELQYRSQWFAHPNGRDWTARALLSHPGRGLGLRISDDAATADALRLALGRLVDEKIDRLASLLDADFFHDLVSPDPMRSLLGWLDDPQDYRGRLEPARWTAFVQQCKSDFGFNPETEGEVIAARKLAGREGKWASVWEIFASVPERYPGIPDQLGKARPEEQLSLVGVAQSEVWPQDNQIAEDQLRNRLRELQALTPEGARKEAARLEGDHAWRRRTVWAKLDRAPLAFAVEQLAVLAELTAQPLADTDLKSLTADYAGRGWRADDAALRGLALAPQDQDRAAVAARGVSDVPLVARRGRQGAPRCDRADGQFTDLQARPASLGGEGDGDCLRGRAPARPCAPPAGSPRKHRAGGTDDDYPRGASHCY